jgi:hypothetical protein
MVNMIGSEPGKILYKEQGMASKVRPNGQRSRRTTPEPKRLDTRQINWYLSTCVTEYL